MLWSALCKSLRLTGNKNGLAAQRLPQKPGSRPLPRVECLENRLVPATAGSDFSAMVDLTPTPPPVVAGLKPAAISKTAAGFTASIELKGTVSEMTGTATSTTNFDVKKTVGFALVRGSGGAELEHADSVNLKVGGAKLAVDFDIVGNVEVTTAANGDEVAELNFTDTAHLKQAGSPATAAVNFQSTVDLFTAGATAVATKVLTNGTPLASLQTGEVASLQTGTTDTTASLTLNDAAHDRWNVANHNGALREHDTSTLVEGTRKVQAAGPVDLSYAGSKTDNSPTTIGLDSASTLSLAAKSDSADNKLKLNGTGDFTNLKFAGTTDLTDNQGKAAAKVQLNVTGAVPSFQVLREQTLAWTGSGGDTATDHEHVSIPAGTSSGVSPGIVAAVTTPVQASLDSSFTFATAGTTYAINHALQQTGEPILFDFTDVLPPKTTTGGGGAVG